MFRCVANDGDDLRSFDLSVIRLDYDSTIVATFMLDAYLSITLTHEPLKLLSPLDQQDAVWGHQVVKCERVEFALCIDAVEIDVIESHNRAAIFMDQGKRRASNVISFGRLKAFGNAFDHSGLPCSQIAAQKHDAPGSELGSESATKFRGLFSGMG
jgi:hypothetical protein